MIGFLPGATYFKPAGIPLSTLDEVVVTLDELEAIRLADLEGLYQEQAAERMKISRPTFSRVVDSARRKIADALVNGKALRVEGGAVTLRGGAAVGGRAGPEREPGPAPFGFGRGRGFGRRRGLR